MDVTLQEFCIIETALAIYKDRSDLHVADKYCADSLQREIQSARESIA